MPSCRLIQMRRAAKDKVRTLFGRGSYTVPEAARLLKISAAKVRRWAAGYSFLSDGAPRFSEPVIRRELTNDFGMVELSFLDLIELLFVNTFHVQGGVSLPVIRRTAATAAELFGTDHPFCVQRFRTDGETIFAEMQREELRLRALETGDNHTIDLQSGQHVFETMVSPFFKHFTYAVKTNLVQEWYPLGNDHVVVLNPDLSFGEPVVRTYGVPTRALKRAAKSGLTFDEIADWYALPTEAVHDAIAFEDTLQAAA